MQDLWKEFYTKDKFGKSYKILQQENKEISRITSSKLKRHESVHSEEKPFRCERCEKGFKDNSNLKTHIKRHFDKTSS